MVEHGEAVSCCVSVCLGAVAEDYVARRSTDKPPFEPCYGVLFGLPLCRPFYLYVARKPLWEEPWSFNLVCAVCGPEEPRVSEGHAFRDEWFLVQHDFSAALAHANAMTCRVGRACLPRCTQALDVGLCTPPFEL